MKRIATIATAIVAGTATSVLACGEDGRAQTTLFHSVRPAIAKVHVNGSPPLPIGPNSPVCFSEGTAFVISSRGHALTANHVIPQGCNNLVVSLRFEGQQQLVPVSVYQPASWDVTLLTPLSDPTSPTQFVRVSNEPVVSDSIFLHQHVIIPSWFEGELRNPTYTPARITSVTLGQNHWQMCGTAPNAGRSGSPVINSDGNVLGVFTERPNPSENQQNIATIVPIRGVVFNDLRLAEAIGITMSGRAPDGAIRANGSLPANARFSYAFPLDIRQPPIRTPLQVLARPDGTLQDVSGLDLGEAGLMALSSGSPLRFGTLREVSIDAFPQHVFTGEGIRIHPVSHNPPNSPLPTRRCEAASSTNCYVVSDDRRKLTFRFMMYSGLPRGLYSVRGLPIPIPFADEARGWFNGHVTAQMARE